METEDEEGMVESTKVPRLLTIRDVARLTTIPAWRLYQMLAEGEGPPALRIGRTYRISEAALIAWIEDPGPPEEA